MIEIYLLMLPSWFTPGGNRIVLKLVLTGKWSKCGFGVKIISLVPSEGLPSGANTFNL